MKVKKVLKIIGIILAILVVFFLIHTIRNYMIITSLQNKFANYSNSTNYHMKSVSTQKDERSVTTNYYLKDQKQVVIIEKNQNDEITKTSMYNNGERTDMFTETKDTKEAQLNSTMAIAVNMYNTLETDNKGQTFIGSIFTKIRTTTYKDKKCYIISNYPSTTTLSEEGAKYYIEKDTGLMVKTESNETTMEREYEFDNVDDSVFVEPDIGQYKLE